MKVTRGDFHKCVKIFKARVSHLDFGQSTAHTQKYNNKKKESYSFL